jgi:Cu/Ag efflux pump CusA
MLNTKKEFFQRLNEGVLAAQKSSVEAVSTAEIDNLMMKMTSRIKQCIDQDEMATK